MAEHPVVPAIPADEPATVRMHRAGSVATVTIDHPGKHNALTLRMLAELDGILDRLEAEPEVHVVVLTGAGPDFSAGMDIRDVRHAREHGVDLEHRITAAEERLAKFPKPTIAAIGGYCIGGGVQLAIACDLRIATDTARFAITPAKLGIVYPAATVARLVRLLGPAATKRLLFTAELIDVGTALRLGLIGEVVPTNELADRAAESAVLIATRSQLSVTAVKEMVDASGGGSVDPAVVRKWSETANPDAVEGLDAFLNKRPPNFPGHSRRPPADST